MKMRYYLIKRIGLAFFSLFGLSVIVFVLSRIIPGDPARMMAGPGAPEEYVEELRRRLNLDKPVHVQYIIWLTDVLRGELGYSIYSRRSVTTDILEFLPMSLELMLFASLIIIFGSIFFGVIAGRWANKWPDNVVRAISYIGISLPSFTWAIIFQLIFGWWLGWFPVRGAFSEGILRPPEVTKFPLIDALIAGNFEAFIDHVWHLVLPALSVSLGSMAQSARLIRSGMVANLFKDYIELSESHGLPDRLIMFKYLFKPSIIPAITIMGMSLASMIVNAFPVELIYNLPGLSKYAINVLLYKDLNPIVGVVLIVGIIYTVVNIVTDVIVAYLDPRTLYLERGR